MMMVFTCNVCGIAPAQIGSFPPSLEGDRRIPTAVEKTNSTLARGSRESRTHASELRGREMRMKPAQFIPKHFLAKTTDVFCRVPNRGVTSTTESWRVSEPSLRRMV